MVVCTSELGEEVITHGEKVKTAHKGAPTIPERVDYVYY
jgi:hypothetical protein